jgi:methionine-rich copper-binding protein CopC
MNILKVAAATAAAAPLLLAGFSAHAHAHLVKASPAANSVGPAPRALNLRFNETLEPRYSGASVMTAGGKTVAASARVSAKAMDVTPKAPLARGSYMVMWHVVSADGHRMKGQYNFTVK